MTGFDDRLRAGLHRLSGSRPATSSDWARLQAKLDPDTPIQPVSALTMAAEVAIDEGTIPMPQTSRASFVGRWRAPLLVAATVAAVAAVVIVATQIGQGSHTAGVAAPSEQSGDGADSTPSDGLAADGLVFAHHPDQNGGDDALLEGVIADRDGCLAVADDAGNVTVPSFPLPSTDPAALRVGDRVALGGGFADIATVGTEVVIPDACRHVAGGEDGLFIAWSLEILPEQAETGDSGAQFVPPYVPVAPSGDVPPEMTAPVVVEIDTGWAGTAPQHMSLQLRADGALEVDASDTDAEVMSLSDSDGTPLGYIRVAPSRAEQPNTDDSGGMYLFGAVGPSVERLAILTTEAEEYMALLSDQRAEYPDSGPLWTVAGSGDPSHGEVRGARVIWTDLPEGWHGFGVQADAPSPALTVLAYDRNGALLQARQYSPNGASYDLPTDTAPELDIWDPDRPAVRFDANGPNGADGPYVATYPDSPDDAWMDALLQGEVAVQDGCVIVVGPEEETYIPVFPQSQIEPATPPAVLLFNGTDYAPGDPISLGGGGMNTPPEGAPADCTAAGWAVSPE